jgi:hypothetical protein
MNVPFDEYDTTLDQHRTTIVDLTMAIPLQSRGKKAGRLGRHSR